MTTEFKNTGKTSGEMEFPGYSHHAPPTRCKEDKKISMDTEIFMNRYVTLLPIIYLNFFLKKNSFISL